MAKGGKHALSGGRIKRSARNKTVGAHAVSPGENANDPSAGIVTAKKRRKVFTLANILRAMLLLLVCFVMISPLKGCILSDSDYIGVSAAQKIALDDSGLFIDKVSDISTDLIKIDGEVYYKIQFTGTVTDYRYIIDAASGEILARAFYHIDGE